jgi:hypothetical protein
MSSSKVDIVESREDTVQLGGWAAENLRYHKNGHDWIEKTSVPFRLAVERVGLLVRHDWPVGRDLAGALCGRPHVQVLTADTPGLYD